jgi:hypothetical protein
MSGTKTFLSGLMVALLSAGVARAQGPAPFTGPAPVPAAEGAGAGPGLFTGSFATHNGNGGPWNGNGGDVDGAPVGDRRSSWLIHPRSPGCCGPLGGDGPIGYEVYARSGISVPMGHVYGDILTVGWAIEGGGRVLFFNPAVDAAWTVDLGMSNVHYNTDKGRFVTLLNLPTRITVLGQTVNSTIPSLDVVPSGLNQTFVNLALGRECYLMGSGDCTSNETRWRAGVDVGGRLGTDKGDVHNFHHLTSYAHGAFIALHSDLEIPCSCCIIYAGVRGEYGYVWSDVLQRQNNSDIQTINLLFTLGTRF